MNERQEKNIALELLTLWFEEEFARGRCDEWERYFAPDVEVTTSTGEVLGTLADWCAAYARAVNDRPLFGVCATASFAAGPQKVALFWSATDENGGPVHGACLAPKAMRDASRSSYAWKMLRRRKFRVRTTVRCPTATGGFELPDVLASAGVPR